MDNFDCRIESFFKNDKTSELSERVHDRLMIRWDHLLTCGIRIEDGKLVLEGTKFPDVLEARSTDCI